MRCSFREMKFLVWLAATGELSPSQVIQVMAVQAAAHQSIGRIALYSRMLSMEQVHEILRYQADHGGLFGSIACELGLLSGEQIQELLELQRRAIPSLETVLLELGLIGAGRLERLRLKAVYSPAPDVDEEHLRERAASERLRGRSA